LRESLADRWCVRSTRSIELVDLLLSDSSSILQNASSLVGNIAQSFLVGNFTSVAGMVRDLASDCFVESDWGSENNAAHCGDEVLDVVFALDNTSWSGHSR